jgi:hypothetical protein
MRVGVCIIAVIVIVSLLLRFIVVIVLAVRALQCIVSSTLTRIRLRTYITRTRSYEILRNMIPGTVPSEMSTGQRQR